MTELIVLLLTCACAIATIALRKLSIAGAMAGTIIAWFLYKGTGVIGVIMLATFFIAGTGATMIGAGKKERLGIAEKNKGQRTISQVLANGFVAGLAGLFGWLYPHQSQLALLIAAGVLASATADTLSSELGSIYGTRFYNILSLKKDKRGSDGVISPEGTLCGIAGSTLIALIYIVEYRVSINALWIVVAGTAGNFADSVFGASLQRKGWLTNDWVNWLNTVVAAGLILLFR